MTFADAILKLRSERRLSQAQLAKELGVSYTSVNRWENRKPMGKRKVTSDKNDASRDPQILRRASFEILL